MSSIELKEKIIDKLQAVEDENLLEDIYRILNINTEDSKMFVFNQKQSESIQNRINKMDEGDFLSHEEAEKDFDEWLKK